MGCGVNGQQALQQTSKIFQVERIGSIRLGVGRIVVDFKKDTLYASRHRGPGQYRDELRLAPDWPPADDGVCTEWVPSNTTGANLRMIASERMSTTRLL